MRPLVTGAGGLLGSNVVWTAVNEGYDVEGTFHTARPALDVPLYQFDVRNSQRFEEVLDKAEPDVVINCAALTDVDDCERDPDQAFAINGEAPGMLARRCAERDIDFVHVSTDYVFDGCSNSPYVEDDPVDPIQEYGCSKLAGERATFEAHTGAIVPRLSFVYGIHRTRDEFIGFPAWVRTELLAGNSIDLFTDQHITPTRAGNAAKRILELVETGVRGRFHITCRSCVTPREFGLAIAEQIGLTDDRIRPATLADVDLPADRPRYTCLSVKKLEQTLDKAQPTLDDDLDAIAAWINAD